MVFVVSAAFDLIDSKGAPVSKAGVWHGIIESSSPEDARESMGNWLREKYGKGLRVTESVATPRHDLMWIPR
jgi:hypothetical protein